VSSGRLSPSGTRLARGSRRTVVIGALVTVALTALSMLAVAFLGPREALPVGSSLASTAPLGPGFGPYPDQGRMPMLGGWGSSCQPPDLPGQVVDVVVGEQRGHMQGPGWSGGAGWVQVLPTSVNAGTVSLRVSNRGMLTHEIVVLPLVAGEQVGARTVDDHGQVDESHAVTEVSTTCGAGKSEEGIAPGAAGWVTTQLTPGRYELVCNLPGHYAAGMYAELTVK